MNTLYLTYNGTKQTFPAWGLSNPRLRPRSRGITEFTCDIPGGDPASAPLIPFGGFVTVSGIFAGMNGGAEVVIFSGARRQWAGKGGGPARSTSLLFCNAIWDMAKTPFQHYWQYQNPGASSKTTQYFSRINLFQNISAGPNAPWTYFSVAQQLAELITYAATNCGIPIQLGTIDPFSPAQYFNLMPCKAISVWDAIQKVMQLIPDVVTKMDYTTTPPTINFYQRTVSAGTVTLPWSGTDANGRMHHSSDLKDRPDLVPSQVVIQYQFTDTNNGVDTNWWSSDVYPPLSTGAAVQALVVPIDLTGPAVTTLSKTVNTEAFNPTNLAFWKKYKHELADATQVTGLALVSSTINGGGVNDILVQDESGNPINLSTYPNLLLPGDSVSSWMNYSNTPIIAIKAVVKGVLSYQKQVPLGAGSQPTDDVTNHETVVRCVLTNSPVGSTPYQTITKFVQGEAAPTGLAQYWYNALRPTPWEGSHIIEEDTIYQIIDAGQTLNLTNTGLTNQQAGATFNPAWATMLAVITDVEIDFFHGITRINFGPHKHLALNEYVALLEAWRWRLIYQNLNARNTGVTGGGDALDISGLSHSENTTEQTPSLQVHSVMGPVAGSPASASLIQLDAVTNGGQILVNSTKDASGNPAVDTTQPQVKLAQADLATADGTTNPVAKWQEWNVNGTQVAVAASKALTISGSGSGGIPCTLVSIWSTYYLVTDGTNYYRAAKPDSVQPGYGAVDVGVSYTFSALSGTTTSYPSSMLRAAQATTGPNTGFIENQIVNPMPQPGWRLPIVAVPGGTGLTVDSGDTAHGGVPGASITYLSNDSWGCGWFAPADQTVSDW